MPTTSSPTSHRRWGEVENENEVEVEDVEVPPRTQNCKLKTENSKLKTAN
jgi:hypothetical protein